MERTQSMWSWRLLIVLMASRRSTVTALSPTLVEHGMDMRGTLAGLNRSPMAAKRLGVLLASVPAGICCSKKCMRSALSSCVKNVAVWPIPPLRTRRRPTSMAPFQSGAVKKPRTGHSFSWLQAKCGPILSLLDCPMRHLHSAGICAHVSG